ncbi:hypothetical protein E2C01_093645 [Portunus trituberculatus]|uniref:Uncharacterized protein n=1 Tax=Portunus trituberculatus TaxID=210409 RepID=A0A5B7JQC7_PORTR|nr:hypothetical protein [Portunus trituberculatus]
MKLGKNCIDIRSKDIIIKQYSVNLHILHEPFCLVKVRSSVFSRNIKADSVTEAEYRQVLR